MGSEDSAQPDTERWAGKMLPLEHASGWTKYKKTNEKKRFPHAAGWKVSEPCSEGQSVKAHGKSENMIKDSK